MILENILIHASFPAHASGVFCHADRSVTIVCFWLKKLG